jgi:hypothetical protein
VARFTAHVKVAAPVARVWAALVDWPAHGRWVPATRVTVLSASGAGVGARFVGRTGIGPLAFDDLMEVTGWEPPGQDRVGRCHVVKLGRVVRGEAWFEVGEIPGGGTSVAWTEDIDVVSSWGTRVLAPVVRLGGRLAFARMLRAMAAEVEAGAHGD